MSDFIKLNKALILGSSSQIRSTILKNAGLIFDIHLAEIDEEEIRLKYDTGHKDDPFKIAGMLAKLKSEAVSQINKQPYCIGADQILACDNTIFSKPSNLDEAFERIAYLSGKTHQLHTSVNVSNHGKSLWGHTETVNMTMRQMSEEQIKRYIDTAGEEICKSVGAYQLEGLGVQLFSQIEGNYFSILGLPLLPLLQFLRDEEVII